jgi:ubiquinone/menaquinone biosynthesis C-methylase UbiE
VVPFGYDREMERLIRASVHDYDVEYANGAHWDTDRPNEPATRFINLVKSNSYILDAGCGTGKDAFYFARNRLSVIGVDASPVAIRLAEEKQRAQSISNLEFRVGDVEELVEADASLDGVYCAYVLEGPRLPLAIREFARVLKSNGTLYVAIFTRISYKNPSRRDSYTPVEFVSQSVAPFFNIESQEVCLFGEIDDEGRHEHERLIMHLRPKS